MPNKSLADLEAEIDQLRTLVRGNQFTGPPVFNGGLPRVPSREALPTASADYRYALVVIAGTPDVLYVCLRNALAAWEWVQVATGTP
ncbi:MAG: hypothetical protein WC211_03665 [Dehalococcoidia bacterium]